MKKQTKLFLLALAALCLLTACKKKDETLEVYSLGENDEDNVVALDSILAEDEAILASVDAPTDAAVAERLDVSHTYHYRKMDDPALLADRYITVLRGSEQGFVPIDTENRKTVDEPVTNTLMGNVILGRAAVATTESGGSRILRVVVGWSEYAVAVQVAYVEGRILPAPEPEKPVEEEESRPTSISEQTDYFNSLDPRKLGLEGDSMADYMVYPQQGWVLVNDIYCREMLVYLQDVQTATNVYIGSFYLSSDMSQVYQKNSDGQIMLLDIN
ncbi:MAG: hypothetical protein HDT14_08745 [Oscillibacter sp.]|nr:hypothetical protein [Oscillibacter sp.]